MRFDGDALVIGCGLTGAVIARHLAENCGKHVVVWEKRDHIGGNMYDYTDDYGFLVHKYGPHVFHTNQKRLMDYMRRFSEWGEYHVACGAVFDDKYTPTPFNFTTIDTFYPEVEAEKLKMKLRASFPGRKTVTVTEALECQDADVRGYAEFLFAKDYAPYTAKQWGVLPSKIDPSVLQRVPLRLSYKNGYFDDIYQVMPRQGYTRFFENLLGHPNVVVKLGMDALKYLQTEDDRVFFQGKDLLRIPIIYTGPLDEWFGCRYGRLPYRSLQFVWKHEETEHMQEAALVAYPQEAEITRITEYSFFPFQEGSGTSYAVEYPMEYRAGEGGEPYYPVLTEESQILYQKYLGLAHRISNFVPCGRLADFKYYNMDQALERALSVCAFFRSASVNESRGMGEHEENQRCDSLF